MNPARKSIEKANYIVDQLELYYLE
jgi:hypothetical protein